MFEIDVSTPAQFGAFVAWLVVNQGPPSALVHAHTGNAEASVLSSRCAGLSMAGYTDEDMA